MTLSPNYCVNLRDLRSSDSDIVGGKNANLGELINAGLPVPGGFAITTDLYDRFLSTNDVKTKIESILKNVDVDNINNLNSVSNEIRKIIEEIEMPPDLVEIISENYQKLGDDVEVAIRSSATDEDLPNASFAGQMDSFVFVI